ncbi:type III-B CRISPR module-associated protein Cmr3 [Geminisphaera colitermitum]|uniref:type III-B CRISPR module-associated protein Cmr3 n=1 Tax=Geminisphaera colitermitum TaxID=1148786 RepID=UPI0012FEB728|nr:type III-B CRISPR module-associated protein Cmr3 [Geminisphaera colitermitum]
MHYYTLTPQDAWFFRDGRPYNHGESNQADALSQFPPSPRTITGALRAALARANGWNGTGRWIPELNTAFGKDADNLAKLQFCAPFLIRENNPLWSAPLHFLGKREKKSDKWTPAAFLRPAATRTLTDQGPIFLPEKTHTDLDGLKTAESAWLTTTGLATVLNGELPASTEIFFSGDLWERENRVGLKRDAITKQVGEGDLYRPGFIRLARHVALGVGIAGVPDGMKAPETLFPFGGEGRLAICKNAPDFPNNAPFPPAPARETFSTNANATTDDATRKVEFAIIALTPLTALKNLAETLGSGAEIVSACVGKPVKIGGWDSLKNEPLPLEPFHPAGSVWFCRASNDAFDAIHSKHGTWLGEPRHTAHGLGQILIARWPH